MEYRMYKTFSIRVSDEELVEQIPKAAEELLRNLFDLMEEQYLAPDMQTLEIIWKHADVKDGPFGKYAADKDGDWTNIRATLAVRIKAEPMWVIRGMYKGSLAWWGSYKTREDAEKAAKEIEKEGVFSTEIIGMEDWKRMAEEERKNAEAEQDGADPEGDHGF